MPIVNDVTGVRAGSRPSRLPERPAAVFSDQIVRGDIERAARARRHVAQQRFQRIGVVCVQRVRVEIRAHARNALPVTRRRRALAQTFQSVPTQAHERAARRRFAAARDRERMNEREFERGADELHERDFPGRAGAPASRGV